MRLCPACDRRSGRTETTPTPISSATTELGRPRLRRFLPLRILLPREVAVDRTLHRGAFEKVGVDRGPQLDRIAEHEVAEVLRRGHLLLDHLVCRLLLEKKNGHVEMTDVRA